MEGALCVCELADILGMPQPSLSSHGQVLRRAGLPESDKWTYFGIRLPDVEAVPLSFLVREVSRVPKNLLRRSGSLRESIIYEPQVWVGENFDHRVEAGTMAVILKKSEL